MKCPKCGREAWGGYPVERINRKSIPPTVYVYREYLHYRGSKRTVTLTALREIIDEVVKDYKSNMSMIMTLARMRTGDKLVHHYVKDETAHESTAKAMDLS